MFKKLLYFIKNFIECWKERLYLYKIRKEHGCFLDSTKLTRRQKLASMQDCNGDGYYLCYYCDRRIKEDK